jgi:hypothetical protein
MSHFIKAEISLNYRESMFDTYRVAWNSGNAAESYSRGASFQYQP